MSLLALHSIAAIRSVVGISALLLPLPTARLFGLAVPASAAPTSIIHLRLFGSRDLALGLLLAGAIRARTANAKTNTSAVAAPGYGSASTFVVAEEEDDRGEGRSKRLLMGKGQEKGKEEGSGSKGGDAAALIRQALVAGAVTDAIDVVSAAVGLWDGSVSGVGAGWVAGGAAGLLGMAWVGWKCRF